MTLFKPRKKHFTSQNYYCSTLHHGMILHHYTFLCQILYLISYLSHPFCGEKKCLQITGCHSSRGQDGRGMWGVLYHTYVSEETLFADVVAITTIHNRYRGLLDLLNSDTYLEATFKDILRAFHITSYGNNQIKIKK